jgi:hypothetical protein
MSLSSLLDRAGAWFTRTFGVWPALLTPPPPAVSVPEPQPFVAPAHHEAEARRLVADVGHRVTTAARGLNGQLPPGPVPEPASMRAPPIIDDGPTAAAFHRPTPVPSSALADRPSPITDLVVDRELHIVGQVVDGELRPITAADRDRLRALYDGGFITAEQQAQGLSAAATGETTMQTNPPAANQHAAYLDEVQQSAAALDPGPPPQVSVKPGWQTSQGQMTGLFTVAALLLSALGFHYSAAQISGGYDALLHLGQTLGPILALIPVLTNYINSRGKITSNTAWANAAIHQANITGVVMPAQNFAGTNRLLDGFLGGKDWKDPARYGGLVKVAGSLGVPGAGAAGSILDKVGGGGHPAGGDPERRYTDAQIDEAFAAIMAQLADITTQLKNLRPAS